MTEQETSLKENYLNPLTYSERILPLDILSGFVLYGIFLMNMTGFI